jgi:hypothetical protein
MYACIRLDFIQIPEIAHQFQHSEIIIKQTQSGQSMPLSGANHQIPGSNRGVGNPHGPICQYFDKSY